MKKLVVVVDMQKDFVDGALGTKEAQAIVPAMVDYLAALDSETDVVFTRDTHQSNYMETQEGQKLPVPHCIEGTDGWQIIDELAEATDKAIRFFNKPTFGSVELAEFVETEGYDDITLIGVCTGICVLSNAITIKAHLPEAKITVLSDLCACVTPDTHKNALAAMGVCQIDVK